MKILMVCLGNICRSPIAEGVMWHKIKALGLNWTVSSAGTESYHVGEAPHRYSQAICKQHGIDISHLRAKRFSLSDFSAFDKIYVMADDVFREIQQAGNRGRVDDRSMVDYFLNELHRTPLNGISVNKNESVPDPFFGPEEGFKSVFRLIDAACEAIIYNHTKSGKQPANVIAQ